MSSETTSSLRVAVIGGGVSGLGAAHRLTELAEQHNLPIKVDVLEAREQCGGSIVTVRRDGCIVEGGPDSFITQKPWGLALCKRLGLAESIIGTNPDCRRTFVLNKGKLHSIPEGFLLLAPSKIMPFVTSKLFSWPGKMRMGLDLVLPRHHKDTSVDETLAHFVRRRFGQEALERVAQPLVGGIYTANPEKLSLRATMPRFLEMEAKYRSLILGMRKGARMMAKARKDRGASTDSGARYSMFVTLTDGMDTLVDTLTERIGRESIRNNATVTRLERQTNGWQMQLADGQAVESDAVILACPSYVSAQLLKGLSADLSNTLDTLEYASSATMTMAFDEKQFPPLPDGFGFVVPAAENRTLIAVTFSSVKFEGRSPKGRILMRAFVGGAMQPEVYALSDDELYRGVLRDLRQILGLKGEPTFSELFRWPRSMPQYPLNHLDWVQQVKDELNRWPGLAVAGNAFGGIGIPDCVHSGEEAAEHIVNQHQQHST
jgi:oxygen-dependent protoporphyrinogen oxidase